MFDYTEQERYVLTEIMKSEGIPYIEELKYCVKDAVLAPFQTHTIAFGLINKKVIISADTGLGKTLISAGLINILRSKNVSGKWVVVCPCFNLQQTKRKYDKYLYGSRVLTVSDTEEDIQRFLGTGVDEWDVVLVSYQSITNPEVQSILLGCRDRLGGLIVDESQMLANLSGSASNMLSAMCKNIEFVYFLTATPIRVNVGQFINQLYMLNRDLFEMSISSAVRYFTKISDEGKPVGVRHLEQLLEAANLHYISYTRKDLNLKGDYNVEPILVRGSARYKDVERKDIFRVIKGDMSGPAVEALSEVVQKKAREGKQGLIYINLNDNKRNVLRYLQDRGLKAAVLDGSITTTAKKKEKVKEEFLSGELDCLITNLTVGLDLPCDYILFYELTFDFKQMLGRGERGLSAKDLDVIFLIVDQTEEVSYFYENVYLRAKMLDLVCKKDISELQTAYEVFKGVGNRKGSGSVRGNQMDPNFNGGAKSSYESKITTLFS